MARHDIFFGLNLPLKSSTLSLTLCVVSMTSLQTLITYAPTFAGSPATAPGWLSIFKARWRLFLDDVFWNSVPANMPHYSVSLRFLVKFLCKDAAKLLITFVITSIHTYPPNDPYFQIYYLKIPTVSHVHLPSFIMNFMQKIFFVNFYWQ